MLHILARRARLVLGSRWHVGGSILVEVLFFPRYASAHVYVIIKRDFSVFGTVIYNVWTRFPDGDECNLRVAFGLAFFEIRGCDAQCR